MRRLRHNQDMFTDLKIPAGRRPLSKEEALTAAILGIAFSAMILTAVFEEYSIARLGIVLVILFWAPMLVLHELGHAVVARILGWRVREIVIGFGRDLWQWQSGETRIRIKLAPVEGYVLPAPRDARHVRLKSMLIYAAGPGAELLLLGLMLLLFGWDGVFGDGDGVGSVALKSLAIVIVLGAGFNLLPFSTDGGVSDGLGIISSPFMSEESIQLRLLTLDLREMQRSLEAGDADAALRSAETCLARFPGNSPLQQLRAIALSFTGQTEAARAFVRDQLDKPDLPTAQRRAWLNQQARVELAADEPSWLVLDLALQKAMSISPNAPDLLAAKGASLVLRGNYVEGGNLLAESWQKNDGSASDAEMLAYLTIAAHKSNEPDAAEHFRTSFEQTNRSVWLTNRVIEMTGR